MRSSAEILKDIDGIADQLAGLLRRRLELSGEAAEAKTLEGVRLSDPARDRATVARVAGITGPKFEDAAKLLYTNIFGITKARQRLMVRGEPEIVKSIRKAAGEAAPLPSHALVACQGTDGSYAQQAASAMFRIPTLLFFSDFESVFEAVEKGLCPYGVLPIENSSAGSVSQVYDLMVKHRFHIVSAIRVKIDHVLLGRPGAKAGAIREVHSHPHALAQCSAFLKAHPEMKPVPESNTALAARAVADGDRDDVAAIASRACAELYGLDVLAEGVADAANNYTRFICISRGLSTTPDAGKLSLMMSLPHRPGSLNAILSKFSAIDVNLTKLESRPVPGMDFEFLFVFDFESHPDNPAVLALISELAQDPEIERFTFLGAYAER